MDLSFNHRLPDSDDRARRDLGPRHEVRDQLAGRPCRSSLRSGFRYPLSLPYELLDRFKVWVSWDKETKCYDLGNRGTYLLQMYKYDHCKGPMIISGNCASFQIRYSMTPPWI